MNFEKRCFIGLVFNFFGVESDFCKVRCFVFKRKIKNNRDDVCFVFDFVKLFNFFCYDCQIVSFICDYIFQGFVLGEGYILVILGV